MTLDAIKRPLRRSNETEHMGKQFMSAEDNQHQRERSARLVGLAMGMHAFHLVALAVALFGLAALVIYWMLGAPTVMQFPSRIVLRFAVLQIALWGVAALVTGSIGRRLQRAIDLNGK